jgi:hypothetical protein
MTEFGDVWAGAKGSSIGAIALHVDVGRDGRASLEMMPLVCLYSTRAFSAWRQITARRMLLRRNGAVIFRSRIRRTFHRVRDAVHVLKASVAASMYKWRNVLQSFGCRYGCGLITRPGALKTRGLRDWYAKTQHIRALRTAFETVRHSTRRVLLLGAWESLHQVTFLRRVIKFKVARLQCR